MNTRDLLDPNNGKGREDTSIDAGENAHHIFELREEATRLEQARCLGVRPEEKDLRVKSLRAAADLLEIHDATGLNLTQAPNLAAFVEAVLEQGIGGYGIKVQDNGA